MHDSSGFPQFNGTAVNLASGTGTLSIADNAGVSALGGLQVYANLINEDSVNSVTINKIGVYVH